MATSSTESVPSVSEDSNIGAQLDAEILSLKSQISTLKSQRTLQTRALLSSHTSRAILSRLRSSTSSRIPSTLPEETDTSPLLTASSAQATHDITNLYRVCASITTFLIQDPDPNAVDGGKVLGIRIDVSNGGKFVRPYYIMLNKPYAGKEALRVHRHTVPVAIPLASLAAKHLPKPKENNGDEEIVKESKKQDLRAFIRALRREIVGYHNRTAAIKGLRKEFRLDEERGRKGKERERVIVDISAADAEAKQVRIEWVDGRIGRCVVGEKGEVVKAVVVGEDGRDREIERRIVGDRDEMRGIGERLREGIY